MKIYINKDIIKQEITRETEIDYNKILEFLNDINTDISEIEIIKFVNEEYKNNRLDKRQYVSQVNHGLSMRKYYKKYIDIVTKKTIIYYQVLRYILDNKVFLNLDNILNEIDIKPDKNEYISSYDINRLKNMLIINIRILKYINYESNCINSYFDNYPYDKNVSVNCEIFPIEDLQCKNLYIKDDTCIDLSEKQKIMLKRNIFNNFIKNV